MHITLWRAAADDYIPDAASFARDREDAEAYFDNPGYGGASLWRARVKVAEEAVLNLYDERDPVELLAEKYDLQNPGAINVEEWIPRDPDLQTLLQEDGYDWVVVRDSFPEGAETWLWIGPFEREPELEPVSMGEEPAHLLPPRPRGTDHVHLKETRPLPKPLTLAMIDDYRMQHRPPDADTGAPLYDLTGNKVYPADFYERPDWYPTGHDSDSEAIGKIFRARGKPNSPVWIYRSVPRGVRIISPGDWVAITKSYARDEGRHPSDPSQDMEVLTAKTRASRIHTAGDSFQEWGYNGDSPIKGTVVFRPRKRHQSGAAESARFSLPGWSIGYHDDISAHAAVRDLKPKGGRKRILVMTQNDHTPRDPNEPVDLGLYELDEGESWELVHFEDFDTPADAARAALEDPEWA